MEQILQKTLRDNEKVLWFGRPTKTKLLRSPDRVSQYVAWIITAVRKTCTGANGASSMLVATNSRLPPKMTTLMIIGYQKLKPDVRM